MSGGWNSFAVLVLKSWNDTCGLLQAFINACLSFQSLRVLLLRHLSRVQLCATPQMAAHQASPSLGFSRQEHWSGLPFPSPMHDSEKWKVKVKSLSGVQLLATPWTAAYQTPLSMDFPGKSTGVGCHCLLRVPQNCPCLFLHLRPVTSLNIKSDLLNLP